ncbi:hypothetical protein BJ508DRAFT_419850 [Ascobolus immersus RN42]|uniref:Uncharacterized protein n=1 Tax=Ascobolus immersus RN42 TaxID=1160509 RepID=A0A3N4HEK5_ASCIM|nr:hypothetical protein BJ508DRAFT_419850 [Ascobolus immersus RN42]
MSDSKPMDANKLQTNYAFVMACLRNTRGGHLDLEGVLKEEGMTCTKKRQVYDKLYLLMKKDGIKLSGLFASIGSLSENSTSGGEEGSKNSTLKKKPSTPRKKVQGRDTVALRGGQKKRKVEDEDEFGDGSEEADDSWARAGDALVKGEATYGLSEEEDY